MTSSKHIVAAQNALNYAQTREDFDGLALSETGAQTEALCAIAHALIAIAKSLH